MSTEAGAGTRGGPIPPLTVERATSLFKSWKGKEFEKVRHAILAAALRDGEFHADALREVEMSQRNMIGASVNALVKARLLVSTGEHRKGSSAASHKRRSYVYRLTAEGLAFARVAQAIQQQTLKTPNYSQEEMF